MRPGKFACVAWALAFWVGLAASEEGANDGIAEKRGPAERAQATKNQLTQSAVAAAMPTPSEEAYPFSTRHAHFEPARYSDLPGWQEDSLAEAWQAFRQSCKALAKRPAWAEPCARSAQVRAGDDAAIRRFIEEEFSLYQIYNNDRSTAGVITGYYEPLLNGSRQQGGKYVHPIYAAPDDLFLLDTRALPRDRQPGPIPVRIEGRNLRPVPAAEAATDLYTLELDRVEPDIRDKKLRVRLEGNRILPYFTRTEIERDRRAGARVLVWVDNPLAAYSMQVQGSGKVRLPDGKIMRLTYAEQNGRPFTPPVRTLTRGIGASEIPLLRGIALDLREEAASDAAAVPPADETPQTRSLRAAAPPAPSSPRQEQHPISAQAAEVVEALLRSADRPAASKNKKDRPLAQQHGALPSPKEGKRVLPTPRPAAEEADGLPLRPASAFWSDPSYVFFREVADSAAGPVGALGVPLTAGRSLAVDPRTTPLGFPVFISTSLPGRNETLNRLMLAQDTGGAIRGAVRGDYFWGFGRRAYAQASRMKENGRMWLLLPKGQQISARAMGIATRGAAAGGEVECVVADPELCVE